MAAKPKFAHVVFQTGQPDEMRDWYCQRSLLPQACGDCLRLGNERLHRDLADPLQRALRYRCGMGSFDRVHDPPRAESRVPDLMPYPASKAAVSMLTVQYARAYPALHIDVVDPGSTATDFNRHQGAQTVEQGAAPIAAAALLGPGGPTGAFLGTEGATPWLHVIPPGAPSLPGGVAFRRRMRKSFPSARRAGYVFSHEMAAGSRDGF